LSFKNPENPFCFYFQKLQQKGFSFKSMNIMFLNVELNADPNGSSHSTKNLLIETRHVHCPDTGDEFAAGSSDAMLQQREHWSGVMAQ
jgi:hypothetical protein